MNEASKEQVIHARAGGPGGSVIVECMALRDYFAGTTGEEAIHILTLLYGIDELDFWGRDDLTNALAEIKFALADAMLAQRDKKNDDTGVNPQSPTKTLASGSYDTQQGR